MSVPKEKVLDAIKKLQDAIEGDIQELKDLEKNVKVQLEDGIPACVCDMVNKNMERAKKIRLVLASRLALLDQAEQRIKNMPEIEEEENDREEG